MTLESHHWRTTDASERSVTVRRFEPNEKRVLYLTGVPGRLVDESGGAWVHQWLDFFSATGHWVPEE